MHDATEHVRSAGSYREERTTDADFREMESSSAMFADADQKYSAKLRRARLARQVRIFGWSATGDTITKVKLMCRVPEVDRAAITPLFGEIQIEWFAELPNGLTREVRGWDPATESWLIVEKP